MILRIEAKFLDVPASPDTVRQMYAAIGAVCKLAGSTAQKMGNATDPGWTHDPNWDEPTVVVEPPPKLLVVASYPPPP